MNPLERQSIRQTIRCRMAPLTADQIRLLLAELDAMMNRIVK